MGFFCPKKVEKFEKFFQKTLDIINFRSYNMGEYGAKWVLLGALALKWERRNIYVI